MSYRDRQVLIALKKLRVTGMVKIDDVEMGNLTGQKRQTLWSTYRSLKSQGLIEYTPAREGRDYVSWVSLTKKGRETAQEAVQAILEHKVVKDTTTNNKALREQI